MTLKEVHNDLSARSAGRLMVQKVPSIHPLATIAEVEELLLKKTKDLETINYIYVTDTAGKLVGAISVKEVFRLPKNTEVSKMMTKELVTVRPHTDRERAALLAIEYSLKEIPVVDSEGKFLGVVPYNAILHTLHQEHIEDMLRSAGIHKFSDPSETILTASAGTLIRKRLPWLLLGLGGSALAAAIIGSFEAALKSQLLLAAFIPAVTYIADAVGTQSETIFIRTVAIDRSFAFKKYLLRELKIGLGLSLILAIVMTALSYVLWQSLTISITLGLSFSVSILFAMFVAIFLPWFFSRLRVDPALIGGPLDTIVSDVVSIIIYFSIANLILATFT